MGKVKLSKEEYLDYISDGRVQLSTEYNVFHILHLFPVLQLLHTKFIMDDFYLTIKDPKYLINLLLGKLTSVMSDKRSIKDVPNMYYLMFSNYKKAAKIETSTLQEYFKHFKLAIRDVKLTKCYEIPLTEATVQEKNWLSFFKPDKVKKEIEEALQYYKMKELFDKIKLANEVADFVNKEIIKYILDNIIPKK